MIWNTNNDCEKNIVNLMNNVLLGKTIENVRNHRDIKLVITKARRNYLVSEPNHNITKKFSEDLLATEIK